MTQYTTFDTILNKFYDRIEKDENFFNYYNVSVEEAIKIASQRATNYLTETLDDLSALNGLQVDMLDYDVELMAMNFELVPKEIRLIVDMMFLKYMKRDETLLHAMEINFVPSDLSVFSPANERKSYAAFIDNLTTKIESRVDDYISRDRITNALKQTIDYSIYSED